QWQSGNRKQSGKSKQQDRLGHGLLGAPELDWQPGTTHLDGWSLSSLCRYGHFRPRIDNGANRFDLRLIARASELHRLLLTKS
ncbi:hypothetical protein ACWDWS_16860, partial [Streptomyces sp. NPDC003328]